MDWFTLRKAARGSFRLSATNVGGVVVLAAGCFVSAPIVAYIDTSILRASLFRDASRLVLVESADRQTGARVPLSLDQVERLRSLQSVFDAVIAFAPAGTAPPDDRPPSRPVVWCFLGEDAFRTFGVNPVLGSTFGGGERWHGETTAVISYEFWSRHFGRDVAVLGRYVARGWTQYRVVGVMPKNFRFPAGGADIWIPLASADSHASSIGYLDVISRMKAGVSIRQVQAAVSATLAVGDDGSKRESFVVGLEDAIRAPAFRALPMLAITAFSVLLLAAVVLAHLLLAEAVDRRSEVGIRMSLGASRFAANSVFTVRSLILSAVGGAIGLGLSAAVMGIATRIAPAGPLRASGPVDVRIAGIMALVCASIGMVAGAAPLLVTWRRPVRPIVGFRNDGQAGMARQLGPLLVAGVACCATFFLINSALSLESMRRLRLVAPGIAGDQILTATVVAPLHLLNLGRDERFRLTEFFGHLLDGVRRLPGVRAASAASGPPVRAPQVSLAFRGEGARTTCDRVQLRTIAPDYLGVLGIRLERGRALRATEPEPAALVNRTLEQQCWPGSSAEGRVGELAGSRVRIVGVVSDVRTRGRRVPVDPELYLPMSVAPLPSMCFVLRVAGHDPYAPAEGFRRLVRRQDPEAKLVTVASVEDLLSAPEAPLTTTAILLSAAAAATLLVAVLGVYATCAADMRLRRKEIAVRLALGADPQALVVRQATTAVVRALPGIGLGCLFAALGAGSLAPLLFEVGRVETSVYVGCVLSLSVSTAVSAWSAARNVIVAGIWRVLQCE
jgi:putative ABC transport system permease protein